MIDRRCRFCVMEPGRFVGFSDHLFVIRDINPVTKGHMLLIPKEHRVDIFEMSDDEWSEVGPLLADVKTKLQKSDPSITGFNVGANCGKSAGQTVFHSHIHIIPRRGGDVSRPRGGIRGVIPQKRSY